MWLGALLVGLLLLDPGELKLACFFGSSGRAFVELSVEQFLENCGSGILRKKAIRGCWGGAWTKRRVVEFKNRG